MQYTSIYKKVLHMQIRKSENDEIIYYLSHFSPLYYA